MPRSNIERNRNISRRRLPPIPNGVAVIWLEAAPSSELPDKRDKMFMDIVAQKYYYILRYTCISKCLKYLAERRAHEHVIVVMISNDNTDNKQTERSISAADISRFYEYEIVQKILVLSQTLEHSDKNSTGRSQNIKTDPDTTIEIFRESPSLFTRLLYLLNTNDNSDNDLFTAFNVQERALQDVRRQLGVYVWSQIYIGKCADFRVVL